MSTKDNMLLLHHYQHHLVQFNMIAWVRQVYLIANFHFTLSQARLHCTFNSLNLPCTTSSRVFHGPILPSLLYPTLFVYSLNMSKPHIYHIVFSFLCILTPGDLNLSQDFPSFSVILHITCTIIMSSSSFAKSSSCPCLTTRPGTFYLLYNKNTLEINAGNFPKSLPTTSNSSRNAFVNTTTCTNHIT